jgi:hypothetical protein
MSLVLNLKGLAAERAWYLYKHIREKISATISWARLISFCVEVLTTRANRKLMKFGYADILILSDQSTKTSMVWQR